MVLYSERVQEGLPGPFPTVKHTRELLDKTFFPHLMERMRKRLVELEKINDAAEPDKLLSTIQLKAEKMTKRFKKENIKDEADRNAWRKCKILIKKKLADNMDELKPLVEESYDSD